MGDEQWPQYAIELQAERSRVSRELDQKGRLLRSIDSVLKAKPEEMFAVLRVSEWAYDGASNLLGESSGNPRYCCVVKVDVGTSGSMKYKEGKLILSGSNFTVFNNLGGYQGDPFENAASANPMKLSANYRLFSVERGLLVWNGVIPAGYLEEFDMPTSHGEMPSRSGESPPQYLWGEMRESIAVVVGNEAVRSVFGVEGDVTDLRGFYRILLEHYGIDEPEEQGLSSVSERVKLTGAQFFTQGLFEMSGLQNDVGYWREQMGVGDGLPAAMREFRELVER